MFPKLFKRLQDCVKGKNAEAEEIEEEFVPPVLYPVQVEMSVEMMCRRREEVLRQRYGATEDKEGYIL